MTITNQINIFKKNMQKEAQYDLDRKTAKLSALSSNNLDKYEYLASKDLRLKPSTIEQTKFKYSPLGKILWLKIKGLKKDDQKEGLPKRLKNIENAQGKQQQKPPIVFDYLKSLSQKRKRLDRQNGRCKWWHWPW